MLIHLGNNHYVPYENISLISPLPEFKSKNYKERFEIYDELNRLIKINGNKAAKTIIYLKDGNVVITNISSTTIYKRVAETFKSVN